MKKWNHEWNGDALTIVLSMSILFNRSTIITRPIPGEVFQSHDRIEVFVYKVEDNPRGVNVFVSRSHPEMIKRLMEQEIPEVYDGTVEIMSVAREAGIVQKLRFVAIIQT